MERTDAEVGRLLQQRRHELGIRQTDVTGVSPATVGDAERGRLPKSGLKRTALGRALRWPSDAIDQLLAGVDPASLPNVVTAPTSIASTEFVAITGELEGGEVIADGERTIEIIKALLRDRPPGEAEALVRSALAALEREPAERSPADT